jgi:hypothetical protein
MVNKELKIGPRIDPSPNAPVVMAATDEFKPVFIPFSLYSLMTTSFTYKSYIAVKNIAALVLLLINADPHPLKDKPMQINHNFCGKKLAGP